MIVRASDCKCFKCGKQADIFYGLADPDCTKKPVCNNCKMLLLRDLYNYNAKSSRLKAEINGKYGRLPNKPVFKTPKEQSKPPIRTNWKTIEKQEATKKKYKGGNNDR